MCKVDVSFLKGQMCVPLQDPVYSMWVTLTKMYMSIDTHSCVWSDAHLHPDARDDHHGVITLMQTPMYVDEQLNAFGHLGVPPNTLRDEDAEHPMLRSQECLKGDSIDDIQSLHHDPWFIA